MRHPDDLMQRYANTGGRIVSGTAMYCGTIGAMAPLAHADVFEMELEDPVLARRLTHRYAIEALSALA